MARGEQSRLREGLVHRRLGAAWMSLMLAAAGMAPIGAGEAAGPAPIDFAQPGTHKAGQWEYRYEFSYDREKKPIGSWGYLYRDGNEVEGSKLDEEIRTPWGVLYYAGVPQMPNGPHGWLPLPRGLVTWESLLMRSDQIARALERAEAVRERLKWFTLIIQYRDRRGSSDPPFNSLTLRTWTQREQRRPDWPAVQVTPEKAMQFLDLLVRSGFLARAIDLTEGQRPDIKGLCYTLLLTTHDEEQSLAYQENLGWNLTMIRRIASLGSVLDTDELAQPLGALLAKLEPYHKEWEKAAADPAYVKARAAEVEKQILAYYQALRATRKLPRETWWEGNRELMPLLVPHLLASSDADVQHQALLMARNHYGRQELVPHIIRALDGLLGEPTRSAGFTRILACEVLAEWPDLRSVPVLVKALGDTYTYHSLGGARGHTEHIYRAVWWEADRALRLITWANPIAEPLRRHGPEPGQREAAQAAWQKWWQESGDRLLKSPTRPWEKGDRTEFDWQLARLNHMEPSIRADAVKAIGRLGGERAIRTLIELLTGDYSVRTAAVQALVKLGQATVPPLIAALEDKRPDMRRWAAQALGDLRDPRALGPLAAAMDDADEHVRDQAAFALTKLGPPAAERLLAALRHDSPRVRKAAAATLHELKDPRAVPPLVAALKDTDPTVRYAAAYSLLHMGDQRAVEPLIAALKDDEVWVRRYAAEGLATFGDSRAVGVLIAALTDKDLKVRIRAVEGLGRLRDRRASEPLIRALQDTHWEVRDAAATSLGALGEPRAVEPLLAALKDKIPSVRCASATALGKLGDKRAVEPLKELLQDEFDYVRRVAAEALKKLQAADPPDPPAPEPRADAVRKACVACLHEIRKATEELIQKHPKSLGHLGPGVVEEKELSLHFPIRDAQYEVHPWRRRGMVEPRPSKQGLFCQFAQPTPLGERAAAFARRWVFSDVGFAWSWLWTKVALPTELQEEWAQLAIEAMRPLDGLENAAIAADLAKRTEEPYVLRGKPGLEMTIQLAEKQDQPGLHAVELLSTNRTDKSIALHPPEFQFIQDGALRHWEAQGLGLSLLVVRAMTGTKDPFIYLKPGEHKRICFCYLPKLTPGRHRMRIACVHAHDGWTDTRPMAADGPPVFRKVENAWLGVVVSNQLEFTVGKGGEARLLPIPADLKPGSYGSGDWRYEFRRPEKDTYDGVLTYKGKPIEGARHYDRVTTPWGTLMYFDRKLTMGHSDGWLPMMVHSLTREECEKGRDLTPREPVK